jgi:hypothetical protein
MFWNETAIAKEYIMAGYTNADGTKVLYWVEDLISGWR